MKFAKLLNFQNLFPVNSKMVDGPQIFKLQIAVN